MLFLGMFFVCVNSVSGQIALRGTNTSTSTSTTITINKPTNVVQNDVMIVVIAKQGNNSTVPSLAGWTLIDGANLTGSGTTARYGAVLYRVAGASEGASYTFSLGTGTSNVAGSLTAFSGVDVSGVNPFDVAPTTISVQGSQTGVSASTRTTASANAAVIMCGMAAASNPSWGDSNWTTTSPGALTEIVDVRQGNGSSGASVGVAWGTKATAGPTGTGSATLSGSERNGGILIALKPCAGPTTSNAGPDQYGNSSFPLAANAPTVGTGVWTISSGPNLSISQFSDVNSRTSTFTPLGQGTYVLTWTISNSCGSSADDVSIANCVSNLITNGDFAAGASNWVSGSVGTIVETNPEDTYFSTGNAIGYTAELDSESSIKQTGIVVVPNTSYTVSFIYARRTNSQTPTPTGVAVKIVGATTITNIFPSTSVGTPTVGSFPFTPTSSPISIDFYNNLAGTATYGTIIDNIVLVPTSQAVPIATTSGAGGSLNTATSCAGVPVQLDVKNVTLPSVTYLWTGSAGATFLPDNTSKSPTITFTGSGLQQATVRVTTASGCTSDPSTTYVYVNAAPTLTITNPPAVCSPSTVNITSSSVQTANTGTTTKYYSTSALANAGGASDITTPTAIASSGTYYIRSEFATGCFIVKPVAVTINPLPTLTIVDPSAVCSPSTVNITSSSVQTANTGTTTKYYSTSALANAGGASDITTPTAIASSGTYYIRSEFATGCFIVKPVAVTINPLPTLTIVDPSAVCSPSTVNITSSSVQTANTGTTTKYYSTSALANAGGASDITTPTAIASSGTYYIRSEFATGCFIVKPVAVTINPLPTLTITNPPAVCSPSTVNITSSSVQTANTGTTTKYYSTSALANAGGASDITTPTAIASSGTYYIRSEFATGCFIVKPVTVTINPLPTLTIVDPSAVCSPSTVNITSSSVQTANTGTTTKYYSTSALANAGGASDITTPTAIASSGTYYIRSEFATGCFIVKPVAVTINPLPTLTIVDPSAVCSPSTVNITSSSVQTANTGTTTKYYSTSALANAGGASDITTPTAIASSGTYYIRSEFATGCFIVKPVAVTINPLPTLTIVDPSAVCSPSTVNITSSSVQTANTGTTTKYYSTSALANAGGASDITTPTAIASSGTYYIRSEFATGCFIVKPVTVTINPLPTLTIVDPSAVCSPSTVNITSSSVQTANTGTTTKYYSTSALANAGGASDITTPTAIASSGTYYIRSEFATGCFIVKPVTVTINPLPTLTIVDPSAVCSPSTVNITSSSVQTANTGTTTKYYSTSALANAGGASDITTPTAIASSGTYYIRSEFATGCFIVKPVAVTINPLPTLTITNPPAVCSPSTVNITSSSVQTANTGTTTKYYSTSALANAGGASDITTPTAIASSGTYYIRSEFATGCFIVKPVTVTINPLPTLTITNPPAVCSPSTVNITSSSVQTANTGTTTKYYSTSALANAGGASDITTPTAIASSGTYYIRSEFATGCFIVKPVAVTINPLPTVNPITGGVTTVCTGLTTPAFTNATSGGTWSITPGTGTAAIDGAGVVTAGNSGDVTVVYTYSNGTCSNTATTTLTIKPNYPAPTVGTPTRPTCSALGASVTISGLPASGNLLQDDGTTITTIAFTSSSITVSQLVPGTYRFGVNNGCTVTYSAPVNVVANTFTGGSSWTYGSPTSDDYIDFASSTAIGADVTYCSVTVSNGASVTVNPGKTLTVTHGVHVISGSTLTFEDSSNLMQTNTSNTLNTGDIVYKRIAPKIRQADYVYWSTPVKNQTLAALSGLTDPTMLYSYSGTQWVFAPRTTVMIAGKGYIVRGPETYSNTIKQDFPASFIGTPQNGDFTGETMVGGKYYLLGNPYPSALDANAFITDVDNRDLLSGTLYFWTHNTPVVLGAGYQYQTDDYATWNLSGGTGTRPAISASNPALITDDPNGAKPSGKIGAGQAFFTGTVASGNVTFKNSMRRDGNTNGQFFKPGKTAKTAEVEKHRVWLNMTNAGGAFKQLLVAYIEGATNSYERLYDGKTFDGNKFVDFYSINEDKKLVIQGRGLPFIDVDQVPLGYRTTIAGDFTISIDNVDGDMKTQAIYIEDKKTGEIHDLRASNYTFTTEIGTFADRLVLRYTNKSLGTGDFENIEKGITVSIKDKAVKVVSSNEAIQDVTIFDVAGKLLYSKKKAGTSELLISNLQSSNQVLLIDITLENGYKTTRKIVFQ